jgi:(1->4)-alpha-D-glucan 1-alpha-D-glucosylmutase
MHAFTARLQQFTAPVTAKGIEDTAFYRYVPLASLNEVGGDPGQFGMGASAFHGASLDRARYWPHTMLASTTHDTKRSEDARLRVNVLSEMPAAWRLALRRWSRLNRSKRKQVDGASAPARNDEYLLYQTLVASFPLQELDQAGLAEYRTRIEGYMLKAVREAKVHTSWINPSSEYEQALLEFVGGLLGKREGNLFLDDFAASLRWISWLAMLSGLSHTLVKLTSPGVPDIYQGTELWTLSLVDPDNRRPVDYERRQRMLEEIEGWAGLRGEALLGHVRRLIERLDEGGPKLYILWRALALRREQEALFRRGGYQPLEVRGARAGNLVAFARVHEGQALVGLAPRLYAGLAPEAGSLPLGEAVWGDTRVDLSSLPSAESLDSALDGRQLKLAVHAGGRELPVAEALSQFPVALLRLS